MKVRLNPLRAASRRAAACRATVGVAMFVSAAMAVSTSSSAQKASNGEIPARFLPKGGYTPPTIDPLRAPAAWTDGPRPTDTTTTGHVAAFKADGDHAKKFWVESVAGGVDATQTVVVIPQFHRSDTQPIDWTTLGGEIRDVQNNIDVVITRMAAVHGLDCVVTEGSALNNIQTPLELKQLASWHRDLTLAKEDAASVFANRGESIAGPLRTVETILDDALRKRLVMLDGAGVALSRLPPDERESIRRLGLENLALNQSGVDLLRKVTAIEEELALLEPATQSTTADVMGVMWLDEFPAHAAKILDPFDAALIALDVERKALLNAGADDAADVLRRFTSRSKLIAGGLIRSEEVRGYHAYYTEVENRALDAMDAGPSPAAAKPLRLTSAQKRKKRSLTKRRDRLWKKYEAITKAKRETFAAQRVVTALPNAPGSICAVVMGANHAAALVEAIAVEAKKKKRKIGIVTVAPFHF